MTDKLHHIADVPVLVCAPDGPAVEVERDATDLIGEGSYQGARWVVLPVSRLTDDFFHLRTRIAGDIVQKFATYRMGLIVMGDISPHTESSDALRDFVRESNRGRQLWFVPDTEALQQRLACQ